MHGSHAVGDRNAGEVCYGGSDRMNTGERAENLGKDVTARVVAELAAAMRRKPANEARLAGVTRALAPHSFELRAMAAEVADWLVRRAVFDRPLYCALIRALAETEPDRAAPMLARALSGPDAGGFAALSAACFCQHPELSVPLARVATNRHPHLAFAAAVARAARGEADGTQLTELAPRIKESHRIALCVELFMPLLRGLTLPSSIGPALAVLRDAERHLGRWLILAEVAHKAGDPKPVQEAQEKAADGPTTARTAWSLVIWALCGGDQPPAQRPTVELIARLSDRPSAERDMTFLFRMAAAKAPGARMMLESLIKPPGLVEDMAVRAALYLVRDHGRDDLVPALEAAARPSKQQEQRGLAIAALWDAGRKQTALELAHHAMRSRSLSTLAWAGLVQTASARKSQQPVVDEPNYRRIQTGWLD